MPHSLFSCLIWESSDSIGKHRQQMQNFPKTKSPCSPKGTRTENTISAVPPCLPEIRPLCTAPTRRLPVNAGNASEDTLVTHFPLPSAAHLLPRFSLCSQLCRTLCGCALQLYFRFVGFNLCYALYTPFVYVCQELFFAERGLFSRRFVNIPAPRP